MNPRLNFEYYSTFAPISDTLLMDEPVTTNKSYLDSVPLTNIDNGYQIFKLTSEQASELTTNKKGS